MGGSDPVGLGLVRSLAHPGGNITGTADLDIDLGPKRMEILRELVPGLKRVLLPYDATNAYAVAQLAAYRDAARRLGLTLVERPVSTEEEARAVIARIRKGEVDGIFSPRFLSRIFLVSSSTPRRSRDCRQCFTECFSWSAADWRPILQRTTS